MQKLHIVSYSQVSFSNRKEAGRLLSEELKKLKVEADVVAGIPRGGIIVAAEISQGLNAQLDIALSRKIGAPNNPEFAIAAVSEDGNLFINEMTKQHFDKIDEYLKIEKARQLNEIKRRIEVFRKIRPKVPLGGKIVVVTDDGIATGATLEAAILAIRNESPKKIIVALPVGPRYNLEKLAKEADMTISLAAPAFFASVGQFYEDFSQTTDEDVLEVLKKNYKRQG